MTWVSRSILTLLWESDYSWCLLCCVFVFGVMWQSVGGVLLMVWTAEGETRAPHCPGRYPGPRCGRCAGQHHGERQPGAGPAQVPTSTRLGCMSTCTYSANTVLRVHVCLQMFPLHLISRSSVWFVLGERASMTASFNPYMKKWRTSWRRRGRSKRRR